MVQRMMKNISSALMILAEVQKEAALRMQKVPSPRVTYSLRILSRAPHFPGQAILQNTATIQETPSAVSQGTIHSAQTIMPLHLVERTSPGSTPLVARGASTTAAIIRLTTLIPSDLLDHLRFRPILARINSRRF